MTTTTAPVRMLLAGAGLIGRRHAAAMRAAGDVRLAAVADPAEAGARLAGEHGVPHHADLDSALAAGGVDAVVLATPSALHVEGAARVIAAELPVLVEKPLATTVADARRMVEAAERAGVPLATGHHRRHNPILAQAKRFVEDGALGRVVAAHASAWLCKPDDYFAPPWRRQAGAGPVLTNLIHDIDALQWLCGAIVEVTGLASNAVRGHEPEDTAVASVRFEGGALGTLTASDTAVAPWSWELTARENPAYPPTGEGCAWIAGTHGSLSVPDLALWRQPGARGWWEPIAAERHPVAHADPLVAQLQQFAAVARGRAAPVASGRDGLRALAVVEAMTRSAASGRRETVEV